MSLEKFQKALHARSTTIKMCEHESDYAVLRSYMDMECILCHACWNKEEQVRMDADTVKIFRPNQIRSVRVRCLRCDTDVTVQKGCTGCFPARRITG